MPKKLELKKRYIEAKKVISTKTANLTKRIDTYIKDFKQQREYKIQIANKNKLLKEVEQSHKNITNIKSKLIHLDAFDKKTIDKKALLKDVMSGKTKRKLKTTNAATKEAQGKSKMYIVPKRERPTLKELESGKYTPSNLPEKRDLKKHFTEAQKEKLESKLVTKERKNLSLQVNAEIKKARELNAKIANIEISLSNKYIQNIIKVIVDPKEVKKEYERLIREIKKQGKSKKVSIFVIREYFNSLYKELYVNVKKGIIRDKKELSNYLKEKTKDVKFIVPTKNKKKTKLI